MQRGCWLGNMKVEGGLQDLSVDGKIVLKWNLKKLKKLSQIQSNTPFVFISLF